MRELSFQKLQGVLEAFKIHVRGHWSQLMVPIIKHTLIIHSFKAFLTL